jgi:hypothetical protein
MRSRIVFGTLGLSRRFRAASRCLPLSAPSGGPKRSSEVPGRALSLSWDFFRRPPGPLGRLRALGLHVPRRRWRWCPIPAFLVEHPGAGALLIDTGLDPSVLRDPAEQFGRLLARLFVLRVAHGQDKVRQYLAWLVRAERDGDPRCCGGGRAARGDRERLAGWLVDSGLGALARRRRAVQPDGLAAAEDDRASRLTRSRRSPRSRSRRAAVLCP